MFLYRANSWPTHLSGDVFKVFCTDRSRSGTGSTEENFSQSVWEFRIVEPTGRNPIRVGIYIIRRKRNTHQSRAVLRVQALFHNVNRIAIDTVYITANEVYNFITIPVKCACLTSFCFLPVFGVWRTAIRQFRKIFLFSSRKKQEIKRSIQNRYRDDDDGKDNDDEFIWRFYGSLK